MSQIIINTGNIANDGTGDPLRTAFNETNNNFSQIFSAGPVDSNITIANNTIQVTNTNGNLRLATNGIGVIVPATNIVPDVTNARYIGTATNRFNTVFSQYFDANSATLSGSLYVGGDLNVVGNTITNNYSNANIANLTLTLAGGSSNAALANGAGILVNSANANFVYNYSANTWNSTIAITAPAFIGNGSQLTNINATVNAINLVGNTLRSSVIFSNLTSFGSVIGISATGNISTTGNVYANVITGNVINGTFAGNGSGLINLTANAIVGNVPFALNANSAYTANLAALATQAINADTALFAINANLAAFANVATSAQTANTASYSVQSDNANSAVVAGMAYQIAPTANISVVGNITTSGYFIGNGRQLTGVTATANTGNIGFDGDTIYDLNGINLQNSDLTHGYTAGVLIPANGATDSILLNNTYGNVILQSGDNASPTATWLFTNDGNLTLPADSGTGAASVNINFAGVGYTTQTNVPTNALTGSGSGMTVDIVASTSGSNPITSVTINQAGIGYAIGDSIQVAQPSSTGNGTLTVISITPVTIPSINYANGQPYGYSNSNVASFLADFGSNTVSTTGDITANSITATNITATGNIVTTGPQGDITGANVISGITLSASGNVYANNINGRLSNGNSKISIVQDGNITLGIGPFSTPHLIVDQYGISVFGNVVGNYFYGDGSNITNVTGNTGNVTFDNINIIGTGNLHLQPDPANTGSYLDIFLTSGPDLHLVASASANLILGKDNTSNVRTSWDGNVTVQSWNPGSNTAGGTWTFGLDGNLTVPGAIRTVSNSQLELTESANTAYLGTTADDSTALYLTATTAQLYANGEVSISSNVGGGNAHGWAFDVDGNTNIPGDIISSGNIAITANVGGTLKSWTFDDTGNLTLPRGGKLLVSGGIVGGGASPAPSLSGFSSLNAYGNITGGSILTGGYVSASGNVTANIFNLGNPGNLTYSSIQQNQNAPYGSENLGIELLTTTDDPGVFSSVSAGPDYVALKSTNAGNANIIVQGGYGVTISTSNATGADIKEWSFVASGNTLFPGNLSVVGNVTGNYILGDGGLLSNIAFGNGAPVSTTGNVSGGNLFSTGTISASGNIYASNFIGNLANGASRISMANNGNTTVGVGPFNTAVLNINTSTGISVLGNIIASGYISLTGNVGSNGNISALGNITSNANVITVAASGGSGTAINGAGIQAGTGIATILYDNSVFGWATNQGFHPTANASQNLGRSNRYWNNLYSVNLNGVNQAMSGYVSAVGNVYGGNIIGNGSGLTNVAQQTTGSWTVTAGTNNYSFTVSSGTYNMWVTGNIPNGIIAWNALATITNNNVPVVGTQYAWVYNGGGTPIDFVSIPNQFTGTANAIVRGNVAPSSNTNTFTFSINNTSGNSMVVNWGYTKL